MFYSCSSLRRGVAWRAGVLSGEKQRIERAYNFIEICEWFAARCDLILLLFDPYKLDISDEFKSVRHAGRPPCTHARMTMPMLVLALALAHRRSLPRRRGMA